MAQTRAEQKCQELAEKFRAQAARLPPSVEQTKLLKIARQLTISSHATDWINSPGLRPPTGKHQS